MELQESRGAYKGLQKVTRVTRGYTRLPEVTIG